MKKLFKSASYFLSVLFVAAGGLVAHASNIGDKPVEISAPVGGDILPGGNLSVTDIRAGTIFSKVIPFAIKYAIRLAIAVSVAALIIGGYQYMTAYGNAEKHGSAIKTILFALIGLILAITAYGIVLIITSISIT